MWYHSNDKSIKPLGAKVFQLQGETDNGAPLFKHPGLGWVRNFDNDFGVVSSMLCATQFFGSLFLSSDKWLLSYAAELGRAYVIFYEANDDTQNTLDSWQPLTMGKKGHIINGLQHFDILYFDVRHGSAEVYVDAWKCVAHTVSICFNQLGKNGTPEVNMVTNGTSASHGQPLVV